MHNSLLCFWHLSCADHCFSGVLGTQCKVFSIHCSSTDLLYDTACVCISKFSTREPKSIFSSLQVSQSVDFQQWHDGSSSTWWVQTDCRWVLQPAEIRFIVYTDKSVKIGWHCWPLVTYCDSDHATHLFTCWKKKPIMIIIIILCFVNRKRNMMSFFSIFCWIRFLLKTNIKNIYVQHINQLQMKLETLHTKPPASTREKRLVTELFQDGGCRSDWHIYTQHYNLLL